jgi:hypothetical protein
VVLKKLSPAAPTAVWVAGIVESPVNPVSEFDNETAAAATPDNTSDTAPPKQTICVLYSFIKLNLSTARKATSRPHFAVPAAAPLRD